MLADPGAEAGHHTRLAAATLGEEDQGLAGLQPLGERAQRVLAPGGLALDRDAVHEQQSHGAHEPVGAEVVRGGDGVDAGQAAQR